MSGTNHTVRTVKVQEENWDKNIRGDLLVTLSINFPDAFSENQKKLIERAFDAAWT